MAGGMNPFDPYAMMTSGGTRDPLQYADNMYSDAELVVPRVCPDMRPRPVQHNNPTRLLFFLLIGGCFWRVILLTYNNKHPTVGFLSSASILHACLEANRDTAFL